MKAVIDNETIRTAVVAYNNCTIKDRQKDARNRIISLIGSENFKINADEMMLLASMDDAQVARHIMSLKGDQYSLVSDRYRRGVSICRDRYVRSRDARNGNKTHVQVTVAPDEYGGSVSILGVMAEKGFLHHLSGLLDSVAKFDHWHLQK